MVELDDAFVNRPSLFQDKLIFGLPSKPLVVWLVIVVGFTAIYRTLIGFFILGTGGLLFMRWVCRDDPNGLHAWRLALRNRLYRNIRSLDPSIIRPRSFFLSED